MYVKLQEYSLLIFWQVKLIEDEWFSFLKFIKLIHSAGLAIKIGSFKTTTPYFLTSKVDRRWMI